jgi:hypothetical protein
MTTVQNFNLSVDLLRAILWQYNDAENLQGILTQKQAWYEDSHTQFWANWIYDVFYLLNANDFGLSVWSIILGQPLALDVAPDDPAKPVWGFETYHKNFGRGNYAKAGGGVGLSEFQKRMILRLRYFQITTNGTVPEVNKFLAHVFADWGGAYVVDNGSMSIAYVFSMQLPSDLMLVIEQFDLLPRPAGVEVTILTNSPMRFGFGEYRLNFDNGNFGA